MSDSQATLSLLIKAKNLAGGEIGKAQSSLSSLKTGALDGLNVGFLTAAGAAGLLAGALVNGIQGAIDEEASIARLSQTLDANVKSWDGNMGAIDKMIAKRENLGFSDDALRDSLTKLIPATKDVNAAFDLQATAMDLARLKAIPLEEASQALVKVESGQYKMLKNLGIELRDGATQTEALAAVQQVAAGQAQAYGDTVAGKTDTMRVKFDDLTEQVGTLLVPALSTLMDQALLVAGAFDTASEKAPIDRLTDLAGVVNHVMNPALFAQEDFFRQVDKAASDAAKTMDTYAEKNADAREPTKQLTRANNNLAGSLGLVAQNGAAALAAVQDEIDTLTEMAYIRASRGQARPHAEGGWVGLNGPEIGLLGERGPEYIVPNDKLGAMGGGAPATVVLQLDGREVARVVDEHLYYRRQLRAT